LAFWNRKKSELKGGRLSLRNDQAHYLMITGVVPPPIQQSRLLVRSLPFFKRSERERIECA
jgi:hypothetical protein